MSRPCAAGSCSPRGCRGRDARRRDARLGGNRTARRGRAGLGPASRHRGADALYRPPGESGADAEPLRVKLEDVVSVDLRRDAVRRRPRQPHRLPAPRRPLWLPSPAPPPIWWWTTTACTRWRNRAPSAWSPVSTRSRSSTSSTATRRASSELLRPGPVRRQVVPESAFSRLRSATIRHPRPRPPRPRRRRAGHPRASACPSRRSLRSRGSLRLFETPASPGKARPGPARPHAQDHRLRDGAWTFRPPSRNDQFGLIFTGYIEVPADGDYTFYVSSDDGCRLYIGDPPAPHRKRTAAPPVVAAATGPAAPTAAASTQPALAGGFRPGRTGHRRHRGLEREVPRAPARGRARVDARAARREPPLGLAT